MNLQVDPGTREQFRVRVEDGVKKNILAKKPVMIGIVAFALIGFVLLLSSAWNSGVEDVGENGIPVVPAEEGPFKVKPADEQMGMAETGQDAMVYNQLAQGQQPAPVENLLPPTEMPMPAPHPVAVSAPPSAPAIVPAPVQEAPAISAPKAETKVAEAPKATGNYRVQIGSLPSRDKAEAEWNRLRKKFAQQLGLLDANYERADLGAKGVYYRIQAGPLSESAAKTLCGELKDGIGGCLVVKR